MLEQGTGFSGRQVHALTASIPEREAVRFLLKEFFLFDFCVNTPSDFSASHSFISASIVESLHPRACIVEDPIIFSNPIGGSAHLSLICKDLRIAILSMSLSVMLLFSGFMGYGLNLGMGWLASNCEKGKLDFQYPRDFVRS